MCVPSVWAQSIHRQNEGTIVDSLRTAGIAIQYQIVQLIRVEGACGFRLVARAQ